MVRLLGVVQIVMLLCSGSAVSAEELERNPRRHKVHIDPMLLKDALNLWADQVGAQVILPDHERPESITPRVVGEFTARESLDLLIEGTALRGVWVNDKSVYVGEDPGDADGQPDLSAELEQALLGALGLAMRSSLPGRIFEVCRRTFGRSASWGQLPSQF